jgi:hypothetical protein
LYDFLTDGFAAVLYNEHRLNVVDPKGGPVPRHERTGGNSSMKAHKLLLAVVIVLSLFLAGPIPPAQAQWGMVIDSFDTNLAVLVWPTFPGFPDPNWATNPDGAVLGGERDIYVDRTGGSSAIFAESNGAESYLSHGQNPGVRGYSLVSWDGVDGNATSLNPVGLGGVDLTAPAGTSNAIALYITNCDLGAPVIVTVYTNGTDWSQATLNVPPSTYNTWFFLNYATDFAQHGGLGATWTNVGAVTLEIDGRATPDLDITIDLVAVGPAPTAVDLVSFTATPARSTIRVEWETATEIDNLGFNLYRAESAGGPWTQLNESLIPTQMPGSPAGAVYTFEDSNVQMGVTYFYRLEDVDVHGQSTFHGPVDATLRPDALDLLRPRLKSGDIGTNR